MSHPLSYLNSSEAICLTVLEYDNLQSTINKKYNIMELEKEGLIKSTLFPIIYNVKHAIELLLKEMTICLNLKPKYIHNIEKLFLIFIQEAKKIDPKLLSTMEKDGLYGLSIEKLNTMTFEETLDKFKSLVYKYYNLEVIKGLAGINRDLTDPENTATKYKEFNLITEAEYEKTLENVTITDIENIKSDITMLLDIEWVLSIVIKSIPFYIKIN